MPADDQKEKDVVDLISAIDTRLKKVHTQSLDLSFNELFDMYKDGELDISPDFQRLFQWSEGARSRFIESLLLEMPVPPIYVIEDAEGKYLLIDGLQRISSYLHLRGTLKAEHLDPPVQPGNKLVLTDCDIVEELNGKTFDDLGTALQIRLKRAFVRVEVVRKGSDPRFKYHMFKRLNTGGAVLSEHMNVSELRAELEQDQQWRVDEIRFFQNQLIHVVDEKQDQFRRALVVLVYAHFEGYCKFAFSLYANAINKSEIKCGDATFAIAAASLADVFKALRNPSVKLPEFRNELPGDSKLHMFARDREFVQRTSELDNRIVAIPDIVIDSESNLTPSILRRILFRLGLPHTLFEDVEGDIHRLLETRHTIAHGVVRKGVGGRQYEDLRNAALRVMTEVTIQVMQALQQQSFLRTPPIEQQPI